MRMELVKDIGREDEIVGRDEWCVADSSSTEPPISSVSLAIAEGSRLFDQLSADAAERVSTSFEATSPLAAAVRSVLAGAIVASSFADTELSIGNETVGKSQTCEFPTFKAAAEPAEDVGCQSDHVSVLYHGPELPKSSLEVTAVDQALVNMAEAFSDHLCYVAGIEHTKFQSDLIDNPKLQAVNNQENLSGFLEDGETSISHAESSIVYNLLSRQAYPIVSAIRSRVLRDHEKTNEAVGLSCFDDLEASSSAPSVRREINEEQGCDSCLMQRILDEAHFTGSEIMMITSLSNENISEHLSNNEPIPSETEGSTDNKIELSQLKKKIEIADLCSDIEKELADLAFTLSQEIAASQINNGTKEIKIEITNTPDTAPFSNADSAYGVQVSSGSQVAEESCADQVQSIESHFCHLNVAHVVQESSCDKDMVAAESVEPGSPSKPPEDVTQVVVTLNESNTIPDILTLISEGYDLMRAVPAAECENLLKILSCDDPTLLVKVVRKALVSDPSENILTVSSTVSSGSLLLQQISHTDSVFVLDCIKSSSNSLSESSGMREILLMRHGDLDIDSLLSSLLIDGEVVLTKIHDSAAEAVINDIFACESVLAAAVIDRLKLECGREKESGEYLPSMSKTAEEATSSPEQPSLNLRNEIQEEALIATNGTLQLPLLDERATVKDADENINESGTVDSVCSKSVSSCISSGVEGNGYVEPISQQHTLLVQHDSDVLPGLFDDSRQANDASDSRSSSPRCRGSDTSDSLGSFPLAPTDEQANTEEIPFPESRSEDPGAGTQEQATGGEDDVLISHSMKKLESILPASMDQNSMRFSKNQAEIESAVETADLSKMLCTYIPQKKPKRVSIVDGSSQNFSEHSRSDDRHRIDKDDTAENTVAGKLRHEDDPAIRNGLKQRLLVDAPKDKNRILPLIASTPVQNSLVQYFPKAVVVNPSTASGSEDYDASDSDPHWWSRTPSDVSDSKPRRTSLTQDQIHKIVGKNSKLMQYYFGHSFQHKVADEPAVKERETFFSKLYDIVASEKHSNCVDWAQDGKTILFIEPYTFQNTVIPLYFPGTWRSSCGALLGKACDFSEVVRILRGHNFKKCDPLDPDSQEYMHTFFVKGHRDNTFKIKKKNTAQVWKFPSPAGERVNLKKLEPSSKSPQKMMPQQASKSLPIAQVSAKDDKIRACINQVSAQLGQKSKMSVSDIVFQLQKHKTESVHASLKPKTGPLLSSLESVSKQPSGLLKTLRDSGKSKEKLVGVGHIIPERGMRVKLSFAGLEHKMTLGQQPRSTLVLLRGTIEDMEADCGMCKVRWVTGDEEYCCTGFCGKFYLEACALDKQSTDAKWWCQQASLAPVWTATETDSIWRLGKVGVGRVRKESKGSVGLKHEANTLGVLEGAREEVNQHFNRLRAEEARREEERRATLRRRKGVESPMNPVQPPVATQIAGGASSGSAAEDVGTFFRARGTLAEVVERGEMAALERLLRRTYDSMEPQPSGHVSVKEIIFCINRMRVGATKVALKNVMAEHDGGEDELSYGGFLDLMYDLLSRCKVAPTATLRRRSIVSTR